MAYPGVRTINLQAETGMFDKVTFNSPPRCVKERTSPSLTRAIIGASTLPSDQE